MYANLVDNYGPAVQAEIRKTIVQLKEQQAVTLNSFKSGKGARTEGGRLAGLEIPFKNGVPHGTTGLDPLSGVTSFEGFIPPPNDKMFVGLAQMGFTVEHEWFHEKDAAAGFLPETRYDQRDMMMTAYMQEQNWFRIGTKTGYLAIVAAGGGGGSGTITLANDNTAWGRTKGSIRLAVSNSTTAGKRVMYQSYNPTTDALTATFYLTSKASATTAVIVVTDAGTVGSGDHIVKLGTYKRVPFGIGNFASSTSRQLQGASTATYPFLNARRVNGGGALVTPTLMDSAKGAKQTRANDVNASKRAICHLTEGMYRVLGGYSYTLRNYNAERGDADTTFALPTNFVDEDLEFIQDANFEDAAIVIRNRTSVFEYRQAELQKISPGDRVQYVGSNSLSQGRGSTEFFENWGESFNLAYDWRGEDGKGKDGAGKPMDLTYLDNLQIPDINQVSEGISLV
jgi:hypothetical protein